jgi:prevent-host-death family protein
MTYSIAEAKDRLQELIDRALKGETVVITRDGLPAVELKPAPKPQEPRRGKIDIEWLKARRVGRKLNVDAGTAVSHMRDEDEARFDRLS